MTRLHLRAARAARSLKSELNAAGLTVYVKPGSGALRTWVEVTAYDLNPAQSMEVLTICALYEVGPGSANGRPQVSRVEFRNIMSSTLKDEIHRALIAAKLERPTPVDTRAVFAGSLLPEFWRERQQGGDSNARHH